MSGIRCCNFYINNKRPYMWYFYNTIRTTTTAITFPPTPIWLKRQRRRFSNNHQWYHPMQFQYQKQQQQLSLYQNIFNNHPSLMQYYNSHHHNHHHHSTTVVRYFWNTTTNDRIDNKTTGTTTLGNNLHSHQNIKLLSQHDIAQLEEYIYHHVTCTIHDPILNQSLSSLQWLQKRIIISYNNNNNTKTDNHTNESDPTHTTESSCHKQEQPSSSSSSSDGDTTITIITLQMTLQLPSMLYPKLHELQTTIETNVINHTHQWIQQQQQHIVHTKQIQIQCKLNIIPNIQPISIMSQILSVHNQQQHSDDNTTSLEILQSLGPGLSSISHIIAVYSCKGGVGKSTIAVNLAYELARRGGRIGLLDLDLYGPSLPILVQPNDCTIRKSLLGPGFVHPIVHHGVKLLSLGYVNTNSGVPGSGFNNGAAIMKGPMVVKVVTQLLKGTDWGRLDVLILDLPPGTGDVQLAVLQLLQLSGAIAITTPSKLATSDTRKGIEMFTSLGVPTLAVVENMSYFDDDHGKRHYPFGKGFLSNDLKLDSSNINIVQFPISSIMNDANDSGTPLTITRPNDCTKEIAAYELLSDIVSMELLRVQYKTEFQNGIQEFIYFETNPDKIFDVANISLALDKLKGSEKFIVRLFSDVDAAQCTIQPAQLRSSDPKSGDIIPDSPFLNYTNNNDTVQSNDDPMVTVTKIATKRSPSIIPTKVERRGRYGFAVEWADGATIIYSMRSIAQAAGGIFHKNN